jgi:hypothetical protein
VVFGEMAGECFLQRCTCCHEPCGLRRILLGTEDAHAVYARAGFAPLAKPDKWMALQ